MMKPKHFPKSGTREIHESLLIDYSKVSDLIRDVALCEQAREKATKGDYIGAYEIVEGLIQRGSPLQQGAVEIAIKIIDWIVDEYVEEGNYEPAIYWLDKWLSLAPEALYPTVAKADFLWQLDREDEAVRIYRAVVRKHPRCLEGWIGLAQIAVGRGHYRRGLQYVQRAWLSLSQPVWAYSLPSKDVVINVIESLYALTARIIFALGTPREATNLLRGALLDLGDSDYLRQHLESLEKHLRRDEGE